MTGSGLHTTWEYATLQVDWTWLGGEDYEFKVVANSDSETLFEETITRMYWSGPLAKMGQMGLELVGLNAQNVLAQGFLKGYDDRLISTPVRMVFFFKRPSLK